VYISCQFKDIGLYLKVNISGVSLHISGSFFRIDMMGGVIFFSVLRLGDYYMFSFPFIVWRAILSIYNFYWNLLPLSFVNVMI